MHRAPAPPGILSDLRIDLAIAIVLLVAAGRPGAERGIGARVLEAGSPRDLERPLVGVALRSPPGVGPGAPIGLVERRPVCRRARVLPPEPHP